MHRVATVIARYHAELAPRYPVGEVEAIVRRMFDHQLGWDPLQMEIRKGDRLPEEDLAKLHAPLMRLRAGEPVQYVLGEVEFAGLRLKVDPSVLIPRPETEELVELILNGTRRAPRTIIDVGTGSGCIALALKRAFPRARVIGTDVSDGALHVARANGRSTGLDVAWRLEDILGGATLDPADLVVSNPPYVPRNEAGTLATHVVEHEPHGALFVPDEDPLLFHRVIAAKAFASMEQGGSLWFEVHHGGAGPVVDLLARGGWDRPTALADMSGARRFIHARR